ncbi:non-ribosomal peptide synthetase [Anabaena azotica]|uniref:Amino acid adenylation domain-containing protein n=1 Tax=Anabaena azotica FACHB-119 TaxID=947527 RepID=A0ABR8D4T3_9NOST|nr:non-ribosomal peptide synthetase [Anabaena azotica]MBD2502164.1 amino acid adenylation domain-containing protein [Anabaena azotica FACHB-119]
MSKSIVEFVCHLRNLNINLETDGDRLRCHAPEGALTPTLRQEIAARKTEIIQFLQQAKQVKAAHQSPIPKVSRDVELPLSFAQQRLWFLHHLSPDSHSYNALVSLRLNGSLNIAVLEQSLNELVRRHEVLRTTFPTVEGKPVQLIADPSTLILPVYDLQGLSTQEQTDRVRQIAESVASQAFDLAVGPLVQFILLQLSEQEYVLLLKIHHIIYDGWSLSIFIRELSALYKAFLQGLPNPLPQLPIQYVDFAVWQRQWLTGEVLERQLTYWQEQLAGVSGVLELPTDKPRPPVQSFRGGIECFQLDRDLTQRLLQLSQESDATLFMTLLAAFFVLLSRYTGQSDIVVGSPIANRNHHSVEQIMGFFANTLALRGNLSDNPTFAELLAQVRQTTLSAYAHQDLPFEMLVEKLQSERDLSRNPLVQVMFAFQNAPEFSWNLPGVTIQDMPLPLEETVRFDLELNCQEVGGSLEGIWSYSSDLFDAKTITRLAGHFQTLLQAIVANPKMKIGELPLLSPTEQHQILVEWNNTTKAYPQDKCIHELFAAQVERTPDAIAAVFAGQKLTYRELDEQANQLAQYLQSLGVKAEVMVGLCVERCLEMMVGLLAILKAGGVYVPIDPAYPQERIAYILSDSQLSVVLTQEKFVASLPNYQGRVVCLDALEQELLGASDRPITDVTPENLAYIIYTSGSTGKPKGVAIAHRGLCNLAAAFIKSFDVRPDSCVLQFASLSFDASISEIFMAICAGAKLYLGSPESMQPGPALLELLQQQKITHAILVPSAVAALPFAELPDLQSLIVAGEACPASLVEKWASGRRFFNAYGPTESTVCATFAQCQPGEQPLIGRPIDNTQIYILDAHLQPVPVGVPGELHIASVGLARGYLNRPDLTDEKFIFHTFSDELGCRLYKTGDQARYVSDGNIEYLGRIDAQVKVRGFRIELGEIEAVLSLHEEVQSCCAIAREDSPGDKRLVAYVVPHQQHTPTISQLRQFLTSKLPFYMVPNTIVFLESLPLTPNGKVDRRALRTINTQSSEETIKVLPRDTVELQLAQIWSAVLGINQVGVTENFFELGGHSLLAVSLMSLVQQQFGKNLPLTTLFQHGTVEQLATVLRQETVSQTWSPLVPIQSTGSKPPFFCIHPVGGNVLCYADLARNLGSEQPVYGLQAIGLNEEEPLTRIEDMATVYIEAIKTIQPTGPYYLGGWSMGGVIAFEMAQQLLTNTEEVALLALIDSYVPTLISSVTIDGQHIPSPEELDDPYEVAYYFVQDMAGILNQERSLSVEELRDIPQEELLVYILNWAKTAHVLPPEFSEQQLHSWLRLFQANRQAFFRYFPRPYSGRTIFLQSDQTSVRDSGWNKVISSLEEQIISGNHYNLLNSTTIAQNLRKYLT